jgi:hypothetical protein
MTSRSSVYSGILEFRCRRKRLCLLLCLASISTLKRDGLRFATRVNFYQTARHHIPKDSTSPSDRCEKLNPDTLASWEHVSRLTHTHLLYCVTSVYTTY